MQIGIRLAGLSYIQVTSPLHLCVPCALQTSTLINTCQFFVNSTALNRKLNCFSAVERISVSADVCGHLANRFRVCPK